MFSGPNAPTSAAVRKRTARKGSSVRAGPEPASELPLGNVEAGPPAAGGGAKRKVEGAEELRPL
eukprot:3294768-Heterocapsa_arctica.AAC.1